MKRISAGCSIPVLLVLFVACSTTSPRPESEPHASASSEPAAASSAAPAPTSTDGFIRQAGAPEPLACTTDADCTYGQTYDASGCCGTFRDMAASVQSRAYLTFAGEWRKEHCEGHACPSPPVPSEPPACLFKVRCAAQRCMNACP